MLTVALSIIAPPAKMISDEGNLMAAFKITNFPAIKQAKKK